jgi:hypothetical protein
LPCKPSVWQCAFFCLALSPGCPIWFTGINSNINAPSQTKKKTRTKFRAGLFMWGMSLTIRAQRTTIARNQFPAQRGVQSIFPVVIEPIDSEGWKGWTETASEMAFHP